MKKTALKTNLLQELNTRKIAAQKSGEAAESFVKFKPHKTRNVNNSAVGPSWGPRKGN